MANKHGGAEMHRLINVLILLVLLGCSTKETANPKEKDDSMAGKGTYGEGMNVTQQEIRSISTEKYALNGPAATPDRQPDTLPPMGLSSEETPQFIIIGSDDNTSAEGINWLLDLIEDRKNPAGAANPATFDGTTPSLTLYWNSDNSGNTHTSDIITALKRAVEMNCEVANHTATHQHGAEFSGEDWKKEMARVNKLLLENNLITKESPLGFRTPFLEYNKNTFRAVKEMGLRYDCSIEEGGSSDRIPGEYHWPYTLNYTAPDYAGSWWAGQLKTKYADFTVDSFDVSHVWELPCYTFLAPHDSLAERYGIEAGLRDFMQSVVTWESNGKITALDYNLYAIGEYGGFELNKDQALATLKHTLDLMYEGNRTPMTLGMHSQFYFEEDKFKNISAEEMREVLDEFITYALEKKDVRIVSANQFFDWYENPVALK
ncbi:MAG: polysaccharide deacetylase family protein [Fibrobacterota bacterium]